MIIYQFPLKTPIEKFPLGPFPLISITFSRIIRPTVFTKVQKYKNFPHFLTGKKTKKSAENP